MRIRRNDYNVRTGRHSPPILQRWRRSLGNVFNRVRNAVFTLFTSRRSRERSERFNMEYLRTGTYRDIRDEPYHFNINDIVERHREERDLPPSTSAKPTVSWESGNGGKPKSSWTPQGVQYGLTEEQRAEIQEQHPKPRVKIRIPYRVGDEPFATFPTNTRRKNQAWNESQTVPMYGKHIGKQEK